MSDTPSQGSPAEAEGALGAPDPQEGGPREVLDTERASASVAHEILSSGPIHPVKSDASIHGPLEGLERWFARVLQHHGTVSDAVRLAEPLQAELGAATVEALVTPSRRLSATDRLGIYHFAYRARLLECLDDDFPTVRHLLGDESFEALCHRYVSEHPSDRPNLAWLGRKLPAFCLSQQAHFKVSAQLVADLARLEWAMIEVLHAQAAATLSMGALQKIPQEQWPHIRLPGSETLRVEQFDHPVNPYLRAVRNDERPPPPEPRPSFTAIYRKGFGIWRLELSAAMAKVLRALLDGQSLGASLALLTEEESQETAVMDWFREWVTSGFFAGLELPDS